MKLHLPLFLLSGILSIPVTMPAAASVIGTGVSYDVGKGSEPYSKDPAAHVMPGDSTDVYYCWAASASNMIQYWQDSYSDKVTQDTPDGYNSTVYGQPAGTRYLDVYEYFLQKGNEDLGGTQQEAINWYFRQSPVKNGALKANDQKFMSEGVSAPDVTSRDYSYSFSEFESPEEAYNNLTSTLENVFSKQGQSVGLAIWQQDPADAERDPLDWNSRNHAVTCWGYEKNAEGKVNALYLTDSDDMEYGVFKVHLSLGQTDPGIMGMPFDAFILQTDDQIDGYGGFVVSITELYAITPESESSGYGKYAKVADDLPTLDSTQSAAEDVTTLEANTIVKGEVIREGAGVKVGKAEAQGAPGIVMLVSENENSSLHLDGDGTGTGLDVMRGSMASVSNLEVSGYEHGVDAQGKVYLYGDTVDVSGNTATDDGAGIRNANYVEIQGASSVTIANNKTDGNGGGIYNGDEVSIRGNGSVLFSGNTAVKGNDIYNARGGIVNIADNGTVQFIGTGTDQVAVVNDGTLYLQSGQDGQDQPLAIVFENSALDSTGGTTYVGQDVNGVTADTKVVFSDTATNGSLNVVQKEQAVAVFEHVKVNAHEIVGLDAGQSSLSNAMVTTVGNLHLSSLALDSSSAFAGGTDDLVTVDKAVITLSEERMTYTEGKYNFDLSGMFKYMNMTLDNVYFDATGIEALAGGLSDGEYINIDFGLGDNITAQVQNVVVLFADDLVTTDFQSLVGGNVEFRGTGIVPEPATSTLSLLALAGLAGRRRRK